MQRPKLQTQACCLGFVKGKKNFAPSEETTYPMGLAKLWTNCIAMALIILGIKAPEETLHQLQSTSLKLRQQMKAATGLQPKASRIPPLVPTFKARIKLQAMNQLLPHFQLYQKCKQDLQFNDPNNPILPKGSKLLSVQPAKTSNHEGGDAQSLPPNVLGNEKKTTSKSRWFRLGAVRGRLWSVLSKLQKQGTLHSCMHVFR